jgi:hypothetical protein
MGPEKILPGSDYTNRSTAFFITGKYAEGILFYRMEKMFSRHGLEVSRACLSNQLIQIRRGISPLIEGMNRDRRRNRICGR